MNLRSNFALTVAGLAAIASTSVLIFSNDSDDVPALDPEHRELTRHWFKKEVNPNGLKTWRRNKWSWYKRKKRQGRAYRYYYDRPGWTPNPNRKNRLRAGAHGRGGGGGGDRNRVLPGCSCTFMDNEGIAYDAMTPAIFGDDYICGACQGEGAFKMAVMDLLGDQTASKYFPCPSRPGEIATSVDLTRADYEGATVSPVMDFYSAPIVDFSSCPEDPITETPEPPAAEVGDGPCRDLSAGGWHRVRHVPPGNRWHQASDSLEGTEEYGTEGDDTAAWSVIFDSKVENYAQFLFATGDCEKWLVANRDDVVGENYANSPRQIQASSTSDTPYVARWYRRRGAREDPWVSLNDHGPAIGEGNILYGGNNFGGGHATNVLPMHGGADVYIKA